MSEIRASAPLRNWVARMLGAMSEERARRAHITGDEKISDTLTHLGPEWNVLHSIEVDSEGDRIDHVLVGPPGVVTLKTRRRPHARVWVGDQMLLVNGLHTNYLSNSEHEAQRVSKLLSKGLGEAVRVQSAIVFVDIGDFKIKDLPARVHVTTQYRLVGWLESLRETTDARMNESIFAVAQLESTWRRAAHRVEANA